MMFFGFFYTKKGWGEMDPRPPLDSQTPVNRKFYCNIPEIIKEINILPIYRSAGMVNSRIPEIQDTTAVKYSTRKSCLPDSMLTYTLTVTGECITGNHLMRKYYPIWRGWWVMWISLVRTLLLWRLRTWRNMAFSRLEIVFR